MAGTVLDNLYRQVKQRQGCTAGSSIQDPKQQKRIGFRGTLQVSRNERLKAVLTGFSYCPDPPETIGVMERIAQIAESENRFIVVYFDDRPFRRSMLFEPRAYLDYGQPEAKQEERKQRGERWLNLDRDWAVSLREYADGDATPRVEPTKQEEIERDGGWFSV